MNILPCVIILAFLNQTFAFSQKTNNNFIQQAQNSKSYLQRKNIENLLLKKNASEIKDISFKQVQGEQLIPQFFQDQNNIIALGVGLGIILVSIILSYIIFKTQKNKKMVKSLFQQIQEDEEDD